MHAERTRKITTNYLFPNSWNSIRMANGDDPSRDPLSPALSLLSLSRLFFFSLCSCWLLLVLPRPPHWPHKAPPSNQCKFRNIHIATMIYSRAISLRSDGVPIRAIVKKICTVSHSNNRPDDMHLSILSSHIICASISLRQFYIERGHCPLGRGVHTMCAERHSLGVVSLLPVHQRRRSQTTYGGRWLQGRCSGRFCVNA